ncbi:hypothetical protein [Clostridium sp.]|nr:hypothetical protein [uncultured Clostridium sp.]
MKGLDKWLELDSSNLKRERSIKTKGLGALKYTKKLLENIQ